MRPLAPYLRDLLEASGLEWSVEDGSKHRKVRVAGRVVLVVPLADRQDRSRGRRQQNAVAALRRAIREAQASKESTR